MIVMLMLMLVLVVLVVVVISVWTRTRNEVPCDLSRQFGDEHMFWRQRSAPSEIISFFGRMCHWLKFFFCLQLHVGLCQLARDYHTKIWAIYVLVFVHLLPTVFTYFFLCTSMLFVFRCLCRCVCVFVACLLFSSSLFGGFVFALCSSSPFLPSPPPAPANT